MNSIFCIYGAGGCGRSIMPILKEKINDKNQIIFIDDNYKKKTCNGVRVYKFAELKKKINFLKVFIAISDIKIRKKLSKKLFAKNFDSLISSQSLLLDNTKIGNGTIISPFCTIGSNTNIGKHVLINLYSYIEHDCDVGNFVTISPGVKCNGNVIIEDDVFIGSGAIIGNGTSAKPLVIGKGSIIGAGAVVLKSLTKYSKIVSLPPKKIHI